MAEAARLAGKQPPVLYSLARDGTLHSYAFLPEVQAAGAAAQPSGSAMDGAEAVGAASAVIPAARPAFTGQPHSVLDRLLVLVSYWVC